MRTSPLREIETVSSLWRTQMSRVFAACALLLVPSAWSAPAPGTQVVHNAVPAAVATAKKIGPVFEGERINLSIGLPLRNQQDLTNLLQQLYDPASPIFHHFLTVEQFTERFGPTQQDYDAVIQFAKSNHLNVTGQFPNRMVVGVRGQALDIQKAFHVTLGTYQHPTEKRTFRAPDKDPSINLAVPVQTIAGLDNFIIPKPCGHMVSPSNTIPQLPQPQAGSGPGGSYFSTDFRAAYFPGTTLTGAGQTVGLLEFDCGFYATDVANFEAATGTSVPVIAVLIDGYSGAAGSASANQEVSLDFQMAIGLAPGLQQVYVYEGSSADDILSAMASSNSVKQFSASWTYQTDATSDSLWMEMAAQGQSYFNASGDSDAYVGGSPSPTDDPNITVVGGTELSTSGPLGTWTGEVVWNSGGGEGTGGGISTSRAIPSWQQPVSMAANGGSTTFRNSPDVAMPAYAVAVFYGNGSENNSSSFFTGTSCATPCWAAVLALANQLAVANGEATAGFINPAVYSTGLGLASHSYASTFHDITSGNNEWSSSPSSFVAATGYDLCTGWGSPNSTNLLNALGLAEPLLISPSLTAGAIFSGAVGGPFSPASFTYTLTNQANSPLTWTLSAPPAWLDVSATSGTLTPGGAAETVVLTLDPSAASLTAGTYMAALSFTNANDHFVQTLEVTLSVESGAPVISMQPTNSTNVIGTTANFYVGLAGSSVVSYQWKYASNGAFSSLTNKGAVSGVTTSNLVITGVSATNAGSYEVVISNSLGFATSSVALLVISNSAPVIIMQPTNYTVLPGATGVDSVAVAGSTPYFYHWYFSANGTTYGPALANSANKFGGTTNATFYITNAYMTNAGSYIVTISNTYGSVTSSVAVVTVTPVTTGGFGLTVPLNFAGPTSAGYCYSGVTYDPATSAFYGAAYEGGTDGAGLTYKVTAAGALTKDSSFTGGTTGAFPLANLCLGKDGNLYSTSLEYGTYYAGVVWKQSATATTCTGEYQLNGEETGNFPYAGPVQASDLNLYGTTTSGGAYNYGTIYKVTGATTSTSNLVVMASFNGNNGAFPSSALIQATDGYLYGTAQSGGDFGNGTIFKMSLSGNLSVVASFSVGSIPIGGVIQGVDGNFYGTTLEGGTSGQGTVYQLIYNSTQTNLVTLYSFTGGDDGGGPWATVTQGLDGNLYGCTQNAAGVYGYGTVFQISPSGTFNTIAQFDGLQGEYPEGNLAVGPDMNLYGTTFEGGSAGAGTFFCIVTTNSGPLQITGQPANLSVYSGSTAIFAVATSGGVVSSYQWLSNNVILTNILGGANPSGVGIAGATSAVLTITNVSTAYNANYSVIVSNAYGSVTSSPAALSVLMSAPAMVVQPLSQSSLVGGGVLFTASASGDAPLFYQWQFNGTNLTTAGSSGVNTNFLVLTNLSLTNSGSYTLIVTNPAGSVTSSVAVLTVSVATNTGSVSFTNLRVFAGTTTDGANSFAPLLQGFDGNLYGTTTAGGANYAGTIFKYTLAGTFSILYSCPENNEPGNPYYQSAGGGNAPEGGLVQSKVNNDFYGTGSTGGSNGFGAFFQTTTAGTTTWPHSFTGTGEVQQPDDTLLLASNGLLYGTSFYGGTGGYGSIFQISTTGAETLMYSFSGGSDGGNPEASMIQGSDGNLYGCEPFGGAYGLGTIWSIAPGGTTLNELAAFDGDNGSRAYNALVLHTNGTYYGVATEGGAFGYGTVFSFTTNAGIEAIYSFSGPDGANPAGPLIMGTDGNLYGTCSSGGSGGQGAVFVITTNGVLRDLIWFDGYNGAAPEAALVQANNGLFYGTTSLGGTGYSLTTTAGYGTIFSFTVPLFISNSITEPNAVAPVPYSVYLTNKAVAPAGDPLTFALVSGPAWLKVATNGLLSGTPPTSALGTNVFVVSLTDTNGVTATAKLSIDVIADTAPTFLNNPFTEPPAAVGSNYVATIATNATTAYLGSGDVLTFGLISGPSWLSVATNGALSGTPTLLNEGTNTFVVGVTNLGGGSATATMLIVVPTPVNPGFIVSAGQPSLSTNGFQVTFTGPSGVTYEVLSSASLAVPLSQWTVVSTGTFGSTPVVLTDTNAVNNPYQFYIIEAQ